MHNLGNEWYSFAFCYVIGVNVLICFIYFYCTSIKTLLILNLIKNICHENFSNQLDKELEYFKVCFFHQNVKWLIPVWELCFVIYWKEKLLFVKIIMQVQINFQNQNVKFKVCFYSIKWVKIKWRNISTAWWRKFCPKSQFYYNPCNIPTSSLKGKLHIEQESHVQRRSSKYCLKLRMSFQSFNITFVMVKYWRDGPYMGKTRSRNSPWCHNTQTIHSKIKVIKCNLFKKKQDRWNMPIHVSYMKTKSVLLYVCEFVYLLESPLCWQLR